MSKSALLLGRKIHYLRKEKGYTLDKLAELSGLSKSYLWELENRESRRPSAEKLLGISDALGVANTYFLEIDDRPPQTKDIDEAFYRNYQKLDHEDKERIRKIVDVFLGLL